MSDKEDRRHFNKLDPARRYTLGAMRADKWISAHSRVVTEIAYEVNRKAGFDRRLALMDLAQGHYRVIPREELLERLLERGKA